MSENNTTFTEETYIAFRRQWRTDYKELSETIRQTKIDMKHQQRRCDGAAGILQGQREQLRDKARSMMEDLKYMKEDLHALKAAELGAQKAA